MPSGTLLHDRVCNLLYDEWDPIGVKAMGGPRDEYNAYAAPLIRAVQAGAGVAEVAEMLGEFAVGGMGLSSVNEASDRAAARQLIDLVKES